MARTSISVGTKGWADRINAAWRGSAENFIKAGLTLLECKAQVRPGDFQRMVKTELEFEPRTAQYLMTIAGDPRLVDAKNFSLLPRRMMTLVDLTKLDDAAFGEALQSGKIHKKMQRADVPKLAAPKPAVPTVTDAEYQDVTENHVTSLEAVRVTNQIDALIAQAESESPPPHSPASGDPAVQSEPAAVSAIGDRADDFPASVAVTRAADDRKGGGSDHHPERDAAPVAGAEEIGSSPAPMAGPGPIISSADGIVTYTFKSGDVQSMAECALAILLGAFNAKPGDAIARDYTGPMNTTEVNAVWNGVGDFADEFERIESGKAAAAE